MTETGSRKQILSHIPINTQNNINSLFEKVDNGKEFEFIFFSRKNKKSSQETSDQNAEQSLNESAQKEEKKTQYKGQLLNKEKYVLLLKYIRNMGKLKKLKVMSAEKTLDINYSTDNENVYRITIKGAADINKIIGRITNMQNKNYFIYKFLLQTMQRSPDIFSFLLKNKKENDTIDIDDLNMRIRLSTETDLMTDMKEKNINMINENLINLMTSVKLDTDVINSINKNIIFRLKDRTSLIVEESDGYFIRLDLTDTKTTRNIGKLNSTVSNYELELEYGVTSLKNVKKKHLESMYATAENILKFVQQSPFIIGVAQSNNVIHYYKEMSNAENNIINLVVRQTVSLEIQHVTERLPNKYAVTDKADGDRYLLIIYKNGVYLISNNLVVKDTGIILDNDNEKYNGTIMDGEYIYSTNQKRHLFMVFDCLRNGNSDLRSIVSLKERLNNADKIINECFIFKGKEGAQSGFKFKNAPTQKETFNINEISKFYAQELGRFYEVLNKDMNYVKEYPLIRRKFFMEVFGAERWEIFKYSAEYWKRYTEDANIKFPYLLDGLIYQPLEQSYITNVSESKYPDYKWKPPVKNSIDFYIEFKRDSQTGKIMDVYDNSTATDDMNNENSTIRNKIYRICTLYVGKNVKNKELPVPFDQNYGIAEAYIYLRDGEIRDMSGDILSDKTVVEFYYQNDSSIIPQQRWVPMRTRYEKTESVERYEKKYGNYQGIAERIWRSIINPVLMEDFIELAKGNTDKRNFFDIKIKELNSKISHQNIVSVNRENKYYQKVSKLAKTMRDFHNFIKSNLIYTYCNKLYNSNTQQSVLDIACGRGGDIGKFYYTEVAYYVGIDINAEGFKSPVDGALSRYNTFRKKKPNFPKMYFIQADARALLEYDAQVKILSGMDEVNKRLLEKFFSNDEKQRSIFDVVDCQLAMHYFLKDELSWNNFKQNLKNHLRNGGYFIATTTDAAQIMKAIGDKNAFTVYYDDSDGNKKKFFEIIKKYANLEEGERFGLGAAIDIYMSWIFDENNYQTEFMVDPDFVTEELERDADLELVDTDLFSNQLTIHKKFLQDAARYESTEETRNYMAKVAAFYQDNEMNRKSLEYSNLHRYYVFRKKSPSDIVTKNKQKGGQINKENKENNNTKNEFSEKYDFSDINNFKIPDMSNYNDKYSMINSLHKILMSHSIFPKSLSTDEFMKDMGLQIIKDHNITNEYLNDIAQKIIVRHEVVNENNKNNNKIQNILDGINLIFVERDCNNFYDITYILKPDTKVSDRVAVLMKEGGLYKPLMRKEEKGIRGIFKMKDDMIEYLIENGEQLENE